MLPQGRQLIPQRVLAFVEDVENPQGVVYRHQSGRVYFPGLKDDRLLWRKCGYRCMGSMSFLRGEVGLAQRLGVREKSLAWHLLTDVEKELAS